jgi:hypothetical protein
MPTDIKKLTKSISFDPADLEYMAQIAKKHGLLGDSAVIRFILNDFRKQETIREK